MNILELEKLSVPSQKLTVAFSATPMFVRKGYKMAPFIEGADDPKFRKVQVQIAFVSDENQWDYKVLTFDKSWQTITWPSIKAALPAMKDTGEIDGDWNIEFVPTGDTYIGSDGTTKERKAPRFIEKLSAAEDSGEQVPF